MKKKVSLFIYDLCLNYCRRVGVVLKEDKDTITLVQRVNKRLVPNPQNPKKMSVRGAGGRWVSSK